jgi:hypothetical protein
MLELKQSADEFLFIISLQCVLFLITGIDYLVHHTLYSFGLRFDFYWATPYWIFLNGTFIAMAILSVTAYRIDRESPSKGTSIAIFLTVCAEVFGGFLDTLWFGIAGIMTGDWTLGFKNWTWSIYSHLLGYYDLFSNIMLNIIVATILLCLWYYRYKMK